MGLLAAAATDEVVTTMPEALVNTALGMGTVFLVLILISFIIYLMKFIPELLDRSSGKKEAAPAPKPAPRPVPVPKPAPAAPSQTDDTQLVAVITAAISAAMEQEGTPVPADGLVIRSIKKRY
ncbi:MAG: OadG family protein [Eubacterium sp.]|jgi:sodium pump decarboxylase gamma subunit|nr:OadG family protein [Eubacterium sp.]